MIVVALVIGGSMAPPMPRLAHLADIIMPPGAALALDGSRAVVLASRDSVGESVAAYNLSHGDRAWFTELPVRQSDDLGMTVSDGVILVAGGTLGSRGPHTLAVDEKTGRLLWTSRLDLVSPRRGSDTVLMSNGPTELSASGEGDKFALDKRTGKVRWYLPLGS
ncbi:MAG TPA: PQQ-binding-like beta-propeller repeat protein, partial [Micromonosporaceae bacterium]